MPERIKEDHQPVRVLVVVEGIHDIEFLTRISTLLHTEYPTLPDLAAMERNRELIFLPISGHPQAWITRLAPLNLPEFHLSDREQSPLTEQRQTIVAAINQRDRCRAMLTKKRSLENYLHPQAVQAIAGAALEYGDHDCVATVAAQQIFESSHGRPNWKQLTRRAQGRLTKRVKHWLNTSAVEQMTIPLLQESDPEREVISWLKSIDQLTETT